MIHFFKLLFGKTPSGAKIFEGMDTLMPNFKITATHVRAGKNGKSYLLDDGGKLASIVEQWRFEPGDSVGRCGYDYQIVFTNGASSIPISICFLCNILIFNGVQVYKTSERQIKTLLEADFTPL